MGTKRAPLRCLSRCSGWRREAATAAGTPAELPCLVSTRGEKGEKRRLKARSQGAKRCITIASCRPLPPAPAKSSHVMLDNFFDFFKFFVEGPPIHNFSGRSLLKYCNVFLSRLCLRSVQKDSSNAGSKRDYSLRMPLRCVFSALMWRGRVARAAVRNNCGVKLFCTAAYIQLVELALQNEARGLPK